MNDIVNAIESYESAFAVFLVLSLLIIGFIVGRSWLGKLNDKGPYSKASTFSADDTDNPY